MTKNYFIPRADADKALTRVIEANGAALIKADKDIADANDKVKKSQTALTAALKDGNEQLQQIGFDAEDAALAEKRAGLDLEKARESLARVQDLPPNSRARREAQLAYAEADLIFVALRIRTQILLRNKSVLQRLVLMVLTQLLPLVRLQHKQIKQFLTLKMQDQKQKLMR